MTIAEKILESINDLYLCICYEQSKLKITDKNYIYKNLKYNIEKEIISEIYRDIKKKYVTDKRKGNK